VTVRETLVSQERIDDFCRRIAALGRDVAGIRMTCLGERNYLKNAKYVKRGTDSRTKLSLTRRRRVITYYRNALRQRFGDDHPSLRYFKLSVKEQNDVNLTDRQKIADRHVDRRPIDVDWHIGTAQAVLQGDLEKTAVYSIANALIAVTGRRPVEIFLTGEFTAVKSPDASLFDPGIDKKHRWTLRFDGQAKREKQGHDTPPQPPYEIPVLMEPQLVLRAFHALRRRYDCSDLTPEGVHDRTSKELGKYCRARYRDDRRAVTDQDRKESAITPSELRAVYTACAYELYAPLRCSWIAYATRILGHASLLDMQSSHSYDKFYAKGSKREYDRDLRASNRELLATLKQLRAETTDEKQLGYLDEKIGAVKALLEGQNGEPL
jgi:hypothetical protein